MLYIPATNCLFLICAFSKKYFWETHTGRYNFIVKYLLKKCAGIIAITEGLRDFYTQNGVDFKKLSSRRMRLTLLIFQKICSGRCSQEIGAAA